MTEVKPWQQVAVAYAVGMVILYVLFLAELFLIGDLFIAAASLVMSEVMRRQGKELVERNSE